MKLWKLTAIVVASVATFVALQHPSRSASGTVADSRYRPTIDTQGFESHAVLLFDEAHRNRHRLDTTYRPFMGLATAIGIVAKPLDEVPSAQSLHGARALMVVLAQGPTDPGDQPAFSAEEISSIRDFVAGGGGLILALDHYPFADAAQTLVNAFGVSASSGMTLDGEHSDKSADDESQLVFSRTNSLLGSHAITSGIDSVVLFTGVSMSIPPGAIPLLVTGPKATDLVPNVRVVKNGADTQTFVEYSEARSASGRAMALVLEYGRGRVAIVGDAAMLTAQIDTKTSRRYGLTSPGFDNELFVANLLQWICKPVQP